MDKSAISATIVLQTSRACSIPDIYKTFEKFGNITGIKVAQRNRGEETKFLSFVIFSSRDNAKDAYASAPELLINKEKILSTEYAIKRPGSRNFGPQASKTRAHVEKKPEAMSKEQLQAVFGCDSIITPLNKDYFFVEYKTEKEMSDAMQKLNNTKYEGTDIIIKMSAAHVSQRSRSRSSNRSFHKKIDDPQTPKGLNK